jgi:hypothetical protein
MARFVDEDHQGIDRLFPTIVSHPLLGNRSWQTARARKTIYVLASEIDQADAICAINLSPGVLPEIGRALDINRSAREERNLSEHYRHELNHFFLL